MVTSSLFLPLLLLLLLERTHRAAAQTNDIHFYNSGTKEASCSVSWNVEYGQQTEHYALNGACAFKFSVDPTCHNGLRVPGSCPDELGSKVDCCVKLPCGANKQGWCINASTQCNDRASDPLCPRIWGSPAQCCMPQATSMMLQQQHQGNTGDSAQLIPSIDQAIQPQSLIPDAQQWQQPVPIAMENVDFVPPSANNAGPASDGRPTSGVINGEGQQSQQDAGAGDFLFDQGSLNDALPIQ